MKLLFWVFFSRCCLLVAPKLEFNSSVWFEVRLLMKIKKTQHLVRDRHGTESGFVYKGLLVGWNLLV